MSALGPLFATVTTSGPLTVVLLGLLALFCVLRTVGPVHNSSSSSTNVEHPQSTQRTTYGQFEGV